MKLLNLGCGHRYHKAWINVNFVSTGEDVIAHNFLKGIPYQENEFDVVYHSHVLEHFSKQDGKEFMKECFRVLKDGGLIRVAVPDLEGIVRNYIKNFEGAMNGDKDSELNYEWIMLELYDQAIRNFKGGEMSKYFNQDKIKNERYVYSRIGEEGRNIREEFMLNEKKENNIALNKSNPNPVLKQLFDPKFYFNKLKKISFLKKHIEFYEIGRFRLGGEIHQWLYDKYSLQKLLIECGFSNIQVKTAFDSNIPEWNDYELESKQGIVYKPDSLFIEAQKNQNKD